MTQVPFHKIINTPLYILHFQISMVMNYLFVNTQTDPKHNISLLWNFEVIEGKAAMDEPFLDSHFDSFSFLPFFG